MFQTFLITWVTHNARISERMRIYEDKIVEDRENNPQLWDGIPVELTREDEREVMRYLAEIIHEDALKILAINICCDHVHLVIVCEEMELTSIIQKLKWWSSFRFWKKRKVIDKVALAPWENEVLDCKGLKPLVWRLWAQKFNTIILPNERAVQNACHYVSFNRQKHNLSKDEILENIVQSVVTHLHDLR